MLHTFLQFIKSYLLAPLILFSISLSTTASTIADYSPPILDIWYGDHQVFGANGNPQKWINILGNTHDPESGLHRLTYSLNDQTDISLMLGPDRRRLARKGDFNIELDPAQLQEGSNQIVLNAVNKVGRTAQARITVEFQPQGGSLPYTIDWSSVEQIQDVAQVIDGKWVIDSNGIRTIETGYDRVLAIGDMSWTDVEVTVNATIHGVDLSGYETKESGGAGMGINIHWIGHSDDPVKCSWDSEPLQPHCGWKPSGSSNWYSFKRFRPKNPFEDYLVLLADPSEQPEDDAKMPGNLFQFGHTYTFKARAQTTSEGLHYRFKVWEPTVQEEPTDWLFERIAIPGSDQEENLPHGSVLLVAHNVDVTFGDVNIVPLSSDE